MKTNTEHGENDTKLVLQNNKKKKKSDYLVLMKCLSYK